MLQASQACKLFLFERFVGKLLIDGFLRVIDHFSENGVLSLELVWLIDNANAHVVLSHYCVDAQAPALGPCGMFGIAILQFDKVPTLMYPAKGNNEARVLLGETRELPGSIADDYSF